jgi:hypothetical protein
MRRGSCWRGYSTSSVGTFGRCNSVHNHSVPLHAYALCFTARPRRLDVAQWVRSIRTLGGIKCHQQGSRWPSGGLLVAVISVYPLHKSWLHLHLSYFSSRSPRRHVASGRDGVRPRRDGPAAPPLRYVRALLQHHLGRGLSTDPSSPRGPRCDVVPRACPCSVDIWFRRRIDFDETGWGTSLLAVHQPWQRQRRQQRYRYRSEPQSHHCQRQWQWPWQRQWQRQQQRQ